MENKVIEVLLTNKNFSWIDSNGLRQYSYSKCNMIKDVLGNTIKSGEKFRITIEKLED